MKNNRNIKHVFLITVDALRADHVGCIGGGNLTPNIDNMARTSLLFSRAFSNGPGTNQSFPAIMTSTYFLMHNGFNIKPHYKTVAEIVQENGFKTAGFHSNPFLSKTFGWDRGFDEFYDFMDEIKSPSAFITSKQEIGFQNKLLRFFASRFLGNQNNRLRQLLKKIYYKHSGLEMPYLEGKELNKQVFRWINKNLEERFFLWMHYMDPHYPYTPPDEYCEGFSNRKEAFEFCTSINGNKASDYEMETMIGLYRGEVRWTDYCIGELYKFFEENGLVENSVIILTADHGEAFMEHGRYGHKPDILYNEVLHVPLLIHGLNYVLEHDLPVQLLDLAPTILDILEITKPRTFLGDNLISLIKESNVNKPIFSESAEPDLINLKYDVKKKIISCIKDEWKLIINELLNTKELYNINQDFKEKNNLIIKELNTHLELEEIIKKHLQVEKKI